MPLIDTLTLKTDLLDSGMPEPQAAAIVRSLAQADTEQLATKADLEVLRADVNAKFEAMQADVNAKFEVLRAEMNTKMEVLRREMNAETGALRGDFKALNGKVNLLIAFNTPLIFAVLALLWRTFFAGQGPG